MSKKPHRIAGNLIYTFCAELKNAGFDLDDIRRALSYVSEELAGIKDVESGKPSDSVEQAIDQFMQSLGAKKVSTKRFTLPKSDEYTTGIVCDCPKCRAARRAEGSPRSDV